MIDNRFSDLISAFRRVELRGQESPEKLATLGELEQIDGPKVTEFFVSVAADPQEYDLARVEALRALDMRHMGHAERDLVARTLARILQDDDDPDVRNYAARALAGVMDIATARAAIAKHLLDREEDEDVRHNAFFAVERAAASPWAIDVLKKCLEDDRFRPGATRVLAGWTAKE